MDPHGRSAPPLTPRVKLHGLSSATDISSFTSLLDIYMAVFSSIDYLIRVNIAAFISNVKDFLWPYDNKGIMSPNCRGKLDRPSSA